MPRWNDNTDDDWDDDREGDEFDDYGDDAEEPTVPCPHCGEEIHEDAQRCPYCENYLSAEDAPLAPKPWWVMLGIGICLAIVIFVWILGGI